jgi:hypothetical protein
MRFLGQPTPLSDCSLILRFLRESFGKTKKAGDKNPRLFPLTTLSREFRGWERLPVPTLNTNLLTNPQSRKPSYHMDLAISRPVRWGCSECAALRKISLTDAIFLSAISRPANHSNFHLKRSQERTYGSKTGPVLPYRSPTFRHAGKHALRRMAISTAYRCWMQRSAQACERDQLPPVQEGD